ncbi:MAG: hypothetical protein OHK0053_14680 [Microscillaceae bacterium]
MVACGADAQRQLGLKAGSQLVEPSIKKSDLQLLSVKSRSQKIKWRVSGRVIPVNRTQIFAEV